MKHFYLHHILNDVHRGLMKMRLCEIQLLVTVCDSTKNLALGDQVDAILLDLSKAFNNVHHQCLLRKLQYNEVGNKTLSWIQSFLAGRIQQVAPEGTLSSSAAVLSGVPQGTVLDTRSSLLDINQCRTYPIQSNTPILDHLQTTAFCIRIKDQDDQALPQEDLESLGEWEHI